MALKNYMEEAVINELAEVLEGIPGACKCERCREDMVAWTLNRLPSKYVVTELGSMYTRLNQLKAQSRTDITVKLIEASKIVKRNPRH